MDYVTDTHSLVWYFTEDSRLSTIASGAFEDTLVEGLVLVPTIVLAEIMYICEKGKTTLTFSETIMRIEMADNFDIVPLDIDILKTADGLNKVLEMHDRLIVATALYFDVPLITKDKIISNMKFIDTIW